MKWFKSKKKQNKINESSTKYELRFWFEHTGDCIWAINEKSKIKYGYPIKPEELPISLELIKKINQLSDEYQTFLNWNDPGGSSFWTHEHKMDFINRATKIYRILCEELGDEYIIINEVNESV